MAEVTIHRNKIDLFGTPSMSSGQLIPLLVGAMTLGVVVLSSLRSLVRGSRLIPIFAGYLAPVSTGVDKVERLF